MQLRGSKQKNLNILPHFTFDISYIFISLFLYHAFNKLEDSRSMWMPSNRPRSWKSKPKPPSHCFISLCIMSSPLGPLTNLISMILSVMLLLRRIHSLTRPPASFSASTAPLWVTSLTSVSLTRTIQSFTLHRKKSHTLKQVIWLAPGDKWWRNVNGSVSLSNYTWEKCICYCVRVSVTVSVYVIAITLAKLQYLCGNLGTKFKKSQFIKFEL